MRRSIRLTVLCAAALLSLLVAPAVRLLAADSPTVITATALARERSGFTASFGIGYGYGVLGLQVRYDRPLRPWLHLAPFLAGGTNTTSWTSFTGAAGVSVGLGWRHRLTADLALGPVVWDELNLHGTRLDSRTIYGPNLAAGYEHTSDGGTFQRILIGHGWGEWGKGAGPFPSVETLNLGFGWRIW